MKKIPRTLSQVSTQVLGHLCDVERIVWHAYEGRLKVGGLVIAVTGGILIITGQVHGETRRTMVHLVVGNAFALAFCVGGSTFALWQKHLLEHSDMNPLSVTAWATLFGATFIGLALPICKAHAAAWSFSPAALAGLAYVVFITSAFNYGCVAWANDVSSPVFVNVHGPPRLFPWVTAYSRARGPLLHFSGVLPAPVGVHNVVIGGAVARAHQLYGGDWRSHGLPGAQPRDREQAR